MFKLIKAMFLMAIVMTVVIRFTTKDERKKQDIKNEIEAANRKPEPPPKPMFYYWKKSTIACISEQTFDSFMSAYYQNDQRSMNKYLTLRFCDVAGKELRVTVLSRGFTSTTFMYDGKQLYTENSAISYK